MGCLRQERTGEEQVLLSRVVVGRGPLCPVRIADGYASQEHAVIWFAEGCWQVQDLDSRNGTWLDGQRLAPRVAVALVEGCTLAFGNPGERWCLLDAQPPGPVAERLSTGERLHAADLLMLPDGEEPEVAVYADGHGGWVVEQDGVVEPVGDRVRLTIGGEPWLLRVPIEASETLVARPAAEVEEQWGFHFRVSSDEEYVELALVRGAERVELKPRAHTELLLRLAQRKLAEPELPAAERGWVHLVELQRMMRMDRRALNVQVFRARKQLAAEGVGGVAELVERRALSDQIRLGPERLVVEALGGAERREL